MQHEHKHDTQKQCDQGGIEGQTKGRSHPGDIAFNRLVRLSKGITNTADRADKPDRRYGTGDVADEGKVGFHLFGRQFRPLMNRTDHVLDRAG